MTSLQHISGRALWLVLGGVALFALLSFRSGDLPLDQWIAGGKIELQTNRTLLARHQAFVQQASRAHRSLSDSLGRVLEAARALAARSQEMAQSARTAEQWQAANVVLAQSNQVCMDGLTLCKQRGDSLFRADSVHTDSLRVALTRADSVLQRGIEVARCHFLVVLGCLSRTRSLEVGLLSGLLGGWVLFKR